MSRKITQTACLMLTILFLVPSVDADGDGQFILNANEGPCDDSPLLDPIEGQCWSTWGAAIPIDGAVHVVVEHLVLPTAMSVPEAVNDCLDGETPACDQAAACSDDILENDDCQSTCLNESGSDPCSTSRDTLVECVSDIGDGDHQSSVTNPCRWAGGRGWCATYAAESFATNSWGGNVCGDITYDFFWCAAHRNPGDVPECTINQ